MLRFFLIFFALALFLFCSTPVTARADDPAHRLAGSDPVVKAYYMYWSKGSLPPASLPWDRISHLAHAFIWPDNAGRLITSQAVHPELIAAAKANNTRIIIAVGGWGQSDGFPVVAADSALRATFIRNLKEYCLQHGYDGVDLDWEYPRTADRNNVTTLVREMHAAFQSVDPPLGISIAMPSVDWQNGYDITALREYVDWFGIMTYDFHGSWTERSGHNSPLYSPSASACNTGSVHQSMQYYLQRGVPRHKLLAGLASYGRRFNSPGMCQTPTTQSGNGAAVSYADALNLMQQGWTYHWDSVSQVPWLRNSTSTVVVSFDDTTSFRLKTDYIREQNLRGAMVWALGYDRVGNSHHLMDVLGTLLSEPTSLPGTGGIDRPSPEQGAIMLHPNYPNPFNPTTTIRFELRDAGLTGLSVYDVAGRRVAGMAPVHLAAGSHRFQFDAGNLPSGVYLYRLEANGTSAVQTMLLMK